MTENVSRDSARPESGGWAAAWDVGWLLLLAPVLVFPESKPALTAGVLLMFIPEACRRMFWSRERTTPTPLALPVALLLGMALIGTAVSADRAMSVQRLAGIALGALVFQVIHARCRTESRLLTGVAVAAALGGAAIAAGGLSVIGATDALVPARAALARTELAARVVHPNGLGGLILLVAPGLIVLLFSPAVWRHLQGSGRAWAQPIVFRSVLGGLCVLMVAILLLSRSRSAISALAVSLLLAVALRLFVGGSSRAFRLSAAAMAVVALGTIAGIFAATGNRLLTDVANRVNIWDRAVMMIQAVPLTGVGLNAFRTLVPIIAPVPDASPAIDVAHAHNIFLQTALDVGIPGLCAYLALLGLALLMCVQVARGESPLRRALALALGTNVLAVHVFGLMDAIPLGSKVGVLWWLNLGLLAALHSIEQEERAPAEARPVAAAIAGSAACVEF